MKLGKDWSSRRKRVRGRAARTWGCSRWHGWLAACACSWLMFGCAYHNQQCAEAIRDAGDHETATRNRVSEAHYLVGCPDVLDITASGPRAFQTRQMVGPDGRVDLGEYGKPRVEGSAPAQIAALVADALGMAPGEVHVRVAEYRSQQLFLFGQSIGWQRSVPYRGQETVVDLLRRVGAVAPAAEPGEVSVVRAHLADGGRPEVFHVDWHNIVVNHNDNANLRLMPNDQIHVGESRHERIERLMPLWLRPIYQAVWDAQHK